MPVAFKLIVALRVGELSRSKAFRSKRCHPPFIEAERQSGVQPDRSRVREFLKFSSSLNACCIQVDRRAASGRALPFERFNR